MWDLYHERNNGKKSTTSWKWRWCLISHSKGNRGCIQLHFKYCNLLINPIFQNTWCALHTMWMKAWAHTFLSASFWPFLIMPQNSTADHTEYEVSMINQWISVLWLWFDQRLLLWFSTSASSSSNDHIAMTFSFTQWFHSKQCLLRERAELRSSALLEYGRVAGSLI